MIYLDTGILVRALLEEHPDHPLCEPLITVNSISSGHSLAEAFNTLTGFFRLPNALAAEMVDSLQAEMKFEAILLDDYSIVLREARQRGIQGGIVYDAVHAQVARRLRVEKLITCNLSHFRHVAPDLTVLSP